MGKASRLIDTILCNVDKEKLVEKIPDFLEAAKELIIEIKNASSFKAAQKSFDLLVILNGPLAALVFKYNVQLPPLLADLINKYERIFQDDIFRKYVYKNIRSGKILTDF